MTQEHWQDLVRRLVVIIFVLLIVCLSELYLLHLDLSDLYKPERKAREELEQLRERGETEATLTLVLKVDLHEGRVDLVDKSLEWKTIDSNTAGATAEPTRPTIDELVQQLRVQKDRNSH